MLWRCPGTGYAQNTFALACWCFACSRVPGSSISRQMSSTADCSTDAWVVMQGVREVEEWMSQASGIPLEELRPHMFLLRDRDATSHLMR